MRRVCTMNPALSTTHVVTLHPNSLALASEAAISRSAVLSIRDMIVPFGSAQRRRFVSLKQLAQELVDDAIEDSGIFPIERMRALRDLQQGRSRQQRLRGP